MRSAGPEGQLNWTHSGDGCVAFERLGFEPIDVARHPSLDWEVLVVVPQMTDREDSR
jgi:hypothetical protein